MDPNETPPSSEVTPVAQQAAPAYDPSAIETAVTRALEAREQQIQSQRQMTPEEQREYFAIFDPAQDGFIDKFREALISDESTPEQRAAALNTYRDGVVNQALRGAEILIERKLEEQQRRLQPAVEFSAQQQAKTIWEEFSAAHPQLKDQQKLVNAVSTQLTASGFKPKTRQEAFSRIAETAAEVLASAGVTLPPASPQNSAQTKMPRMASTNASSGTPSAAPVEAPNNGRLAPFFLNRRK